MSPSPQRTRRPTRRLGARLAARLTGHVAVLALAAAVAYTGAPHGHWFTPATRTLPQQITRLEHPVTGQLVTVTARSASATVAVMQRWERRDRRWRQVGPAVRAHLGSAGLTRRPAEGKPATPLGTFTLTEAFGAAPNTGGRVTRLPYLRLRYGSAWGSDPQRRRTYNRYYDCRCRTGSLYRLRTSYFRYGLVIDYNRAPVVPGAGSGFFVHVTDGRPTDGCVGLPAAAVRTLLGWLRPSVHPRIEIRLRATGDQSL